MLKKENENEILNKIYKEVATFYFSKKLLEKNITYNKLYKYFNTIWKTYKDKISKNISINTLISYSYPVKFIYELLDKKDEIIVCQYDSFVEIDNSIIRTTIDAISYNNSTGEIKVIYIPERGDINFNSAELLYIKAYLSLFSKQSLFLRQKTKLKIQIVSPKYKMLISENVLTNIKECESLIKGPIIGIENNNYYPIPKKSNCQKCLSLDKCIWRNK